jgi:hypothetical protein
MIRENQLRMWRRQNSFDASRLLEDRNVAVTPKRRSAIGPLFADTNREYRLVRRTEAGMVQICFEVVPNTAGDRSRLAMICGQSSFHDRRCSIAEDPNDRVCRHSYRLCDDSESIDMTGCTPISGSPVDHSGPPRASLARAAEHLVPISLMNGVRRP